MVQPTLVAQALPPESIRRKAEEVVARPDYQLDAGLDEQSLSLMEMILAWLFKPIELLFDAMDGLPTGLRIVVIVVLVILLVLLTVHIGWTLVTALRPGSKQELPPEIDRRQSVDPKKLETAAQRAAESGEHLEAIRLLFRAALRRIEQAEKKRLRIGITNRELLRRYGASPLGEPLQLVVETIDRKWFGKETCVPDDYERCLEEYTRLRTLTQRRADALGA